MDEMPKKEIPQTTNINPWELLNVFAVVVFVANTLIWFTLDKNKLIGSYTNTTGYGIWIACAAYIGLYYYFVNVKPQEDLHGVKMVDMDLQAVKIMEKLAGPPRYLNGLSFVECFSEQENGEKSKLPDTGTYVFQHLKSGTYYEYKISNLSLLPIKNRPNFLSRETRERSANNALRYEMKNQLALLKNMMRRKKYRVRRPIDYEEPDEDESDEAPNDS